ncbi:o-succinylbenzoate synthase [Paraliobacillus salinarum]|uniref:o-succinylbenzoate synthase n=1 Tax=Paraliobacillus salinarum TaxID=1158996 RepID=UPI001FE74971|nr:o-succinylbenzoate synthase [Paraliobacillus salinarum]
MLVTEMCNNSNKSEVFPLDINQVILHHLQMNYKYPFVTSHGKVEKKDFYIIEVIDEHGTSGYGETESFATPWYTEETMETNRIILENHLIPLVLEAKITHPSELSKIFRTIRRNQMAKAAIEGAVWDLYAKRTNQPLYKLIGGKEPTVDVGVSIGLKPTDQELLETIEEKLAQGYQRVKLKVKKGKEIRLLDKVRTSFPSLSLMIDANGAYSWEDKDRLLALDQFNLLMIEQPFAQDDFVEHAKLQNLLQTPICLDESIHTYSDLKTAIALHSCKIVNIKPSRVGGIQNTKEMHDLAEQHQLPLWCGGMLEAGVGRAHSLAIATLPQFTLPADTAGSAYYWEKDIIQPEIKTDNGKIHLSENPGIGYAIDKEALAYYRIEKQIHTKK